MDLTIKINFTPKHSINFSYTINYRYTRAIILIDGEKRLKKEGSHRSNQFNFEEITARRRNSPSEFAVSVAGVASGKNLEPPKGRERAREKVRVGGGGGMGVGGPCNDLTAVVTFLISARFNYTVDEEGARPPLALAFPFRHPFVTASSSFPHQSLAQTRPVVLTRHRLANKIWLIALERFLLRSLLPSAANTARKFPNLSS